MHKSYCVCEGTGKWEDGRDCPIPENTYDKVNGFKIRIDGIPFQGTGWIILLCEDGDIVVDEATIEFAQYLGHNMQDAIKWGKDQGLKYLGIEEQEE